MSSVSLSSMSSVSPSSMSSVSPSSMSSLSPSDPEPSLTACLSSTVTEVLV